MNIQRGNKFIAYYLGWNRIEEEGLNFMEWKDETNTLIRFGRTGGELKFNYSWDWLMVAVEKICKHEYQAETIDGVEHIYMAYPRTFGMISEDGKYMVRFNNCFLFMADTLIEATWLAVVDFIETNFVFVDKS